MAPTFTAGKNTRAWCAAVNLSTAAVDSTFDAAADTADTTTYGNSDKTYIATLRDANINVSGLFDASTSPAATQTMAALEGSTNTVPLSIVYGGPTAGNPARVARVLVTGVNVKAPAADVVSADYTFQALDGPGFGALIRTGTISTTGAGTGVSLVPTGASTANATVIANLHVTAVTGSTGSATLVLQHSSNNSSWATLTTWTAVSAAGYQTVVVTGAKKYLRDNCSALSTGRTVTYTVAAGRRPWS